MGSILQKLNPIKEHYIVNDSEADFYNMKGKGPYMVDSFGRKYLKPSVQQFGMGYGGYIRYGRYDGWPRGGGFYPTNNLRYMNRLKRSSFYNPYAPNQYNQHNPFISMQNY